MVESGAESAAGNSESRDKNTDSVKSDENEKDVSNEHSAAMTSPKIILSDDEDEDDDVPGDFFDDFLKEDFMAGLDVVDEDEGEEKLHLGVKESAKKQKERKKIEFDDLKKRKRSKREDLRSRIKGKKKDDDDLRKKLKDKDETRKSIKSKIVNVDEFDIRRDPTKTRRDIERDKARCEKDKEQKIITEKLRLVETGLVPPGMEMETDLEEIKRQNEDADNKESKEKKSQTKDSGPSKNSEAKSSKSKDVSSRRRSSSPGKRSSGRRISPRRRNRSPRRLSRSPRRLSRSPRRLSRSPKRLSRSPRRSPRRRLMSPRGLRKIVSPRRSPLRRSPLRSRDRSLRRSLDRDRNRSRSRDKYRYSPRHRRSHSRSPRRRAESDKKKSFLQELAEKLNETRPTFPVLTQPIPQEMYHVGAYSQNILPTLPGPGPVPAPVPPPPIANQFPTQQHFDRNFFIGTPAPPLASPNNHQFHLQLPVPNGQQLIPPAQIPSTPVLQNNLPNFQQNPPVRVQNDVNTKDGISRLFQDKKITLTEFLAITAKPEVYSASPDHMKQKINVISRCQEAIKYLANSENKYTGPLVVKKSEKQKAAGQKYKSPLLVSSQLKLPFTEIPKSEKNRSEFTTYINDLLKNIGLGEEEEDDIIVIEDEPNLQSNAVNSSVGGPPPAPKISYAKPQPTLTNQLKPHQLSKLCQTHQPVCLKCEIRDRVRYKNAGTQCGNDGMTFTVGTQVSDEDFYMKIAKTQSLAALTPAQLLARSAAPKTSRSIDADDFDLLFPVKKPPAKPPGFGYGDMFTANRFSPTNPSNRFFEPPGPAGGGRDLLEDRMRAEANRLNFKNNYY